MQSYRKAAAACRRFLRTVRHNLQCTPFQKPGIDGYCRTVVGVGYVGDGEADRRFRRNHPDLLLPVVCEPADADGLSIAYGDPRVIPDELGSGVFDTGSWVWSGMPLSWHARSASMAWKRAGLPSLIPSSHFGVELVPFPLVRESAGVAPPQVFHVESDGAAAVAFGVEGQAGDDEVHGLAVHASEHAEAVEFV